MATKLEYDVSVKTEDAKRKLKRDLSTVETGGGGGGGGGGGSGGQGAAAAAKATRSLNTLADTAERAAPSLGKAAKAFAGIGISMAASYASGFLPEGSAASKAIGYGGNIIGGAIAGGSVGGPWGAVAGAVAGAGKSFLEDSGKENSAKLDFFAGELRHNEAREWKARLQALTDIGDSPGADLLRDKLQEVRDALAAKKEAEAKIVDDVKKYIEGGEYYSADFARQSLAINRAQQEQLENFEKSVEKRLEKNEGEKASLSPTDSLSRIGGDFVGAQAASLDSLARNTSQANSILGRIERKISKGGTF